MLALSPLGTFHTGISLVALVAGLVAFARYKEISLRSLAGKTYAITTAITCLTGFGIYHHGGFGAPHVLGILTLLVLGLAMFAGRSQPFGPASIYLEALGYSTTFFFHFIPAITETSTRLPLGAPLIADRESPQLQAAIGAVFVVFLIGATLQVRFLRDRARKIRPAALFATEQQPNNLIN